MKPGQALIAIDPCAMNDDGREVLTVGKVYEVKFWDDEEIKVINDEGELHSFQQLEITEFFRKATSFGVWQSIETAPKDGTHVILYTNPWIRPVIGYYNKKDEYWYNVKALQYQPTHWMPLPELPKE